MRKLLLVSVLTFLIFAQIGLAQDFTANAAASGNYLAGREYVINLSVANNGPTDWFSVSVIGLPASWMSVDTSSGLFKIESGETSVIKVFVRPTKDAIPTTYEYFINVQSTTTEEAVSERVLVPVKQVTEVIVSNMEFSCQECNKEVTVTGAVYNTGTRDMSVEFTLTFLDNVETIEIEDLRVFEQEDFSYTFNLEELPPETYDVDVEVIGNSKVIYQDTKQFIIPRVQDIELEEHVYATPFGRFVRIKAFNNGNYRTDVEFESTVNKAWYILYAGPEPNSEGDTNTWIVNLDAEQDYTLGFSEIYWPTYIIVAILILFGFFVYWNYTALTIRKAIVGKNIVKKGKEMSVSIAVKNKIRKVSNVVIRDVVPDGFSLVTKFETLKPTLRKVTGGTEIVWKIGDLKPYEQRVMHYKIKPTHGISGRKHLSRASIVAKFGDKTIKKSSNYVTIYSKGDDPSIVAVDVTK